LDDPLAHADELPPIDEADEPVDSKSDEEVQEDPPIAVAQFGILDVDFTEEGWFLIFETGILHLWYDEDLGPNAEVLTEEEEASLGYNPGPEVDDEGGMSEHKHIQEEG